VTALGPAGETVALDRVKFGAVNSLGLDPEMTYAICRFDLSLGPGVLSGPLPDDFWSIGVFGRDGNAIYSTTSRSSVGTSLELGIFNAAQTRLLAEQQFALQEGLLIIESRQDDIFVVVRLAPPHPVVWERYKEVLAMLECGHIPTSQFTSET
jgi:uncharacterized membrane protein